MQAHIAKELERRAGRPTLKKGVISWTGTSLAVQSSATSEASEANRTPALAPRRRNRLNPQSRRSPLSLAAGRKTLHTMRKRRDRPQRSGKQLHASASHRDLSASLQSVNGRMEWVRTATAVSPCALGLSRDHEVPGSLTHNAHLSCPPDAKTPRCPTPPPPFPRPPNSSSGVVLPRWRDEEQCSAPAPTEPPARPRARDRRSKTWTECAPERRRVRFDELAGVRAGTWAQAGTAAEQDAYAGRVGRARGARLAERWSARSAGCGGWCWSTPRVGGVEKLLRRSSTMPHLPRRLPPPGRQGAALAWTLARTSGEVVAVDTLAPGRPVSALPQQVEEAEVGEGPRRVWTISSTS